MTLRDRNADLLTRDVCLLRDCIEVVRKQWGFEIEAAAIMPFQMQLLAVFDATEFGVMRALSAIQNTFEIHLPNTKDDSIWDGPPLMTILERSAVPIRKAFIEAAPVRARLVETPSEWQYSTAYRSRPGVGSTARQAI